MYKDCAEFLVLLAKRFGMLKKGGLPDTVKAARLVLQDWNWLVISVYYCKKIDVIHSAFTRVAKLMKGVHSSHSLRTHHGFQEELSSFLCTFHSICDDYCVSLKSCTVTVVLFNALIHKGPALRDCFRVIC